MTISNVILKLEESAKHFPKKTAIYGINKNFTYEEVQLTTSFFSNYLGKIVGKNKNIGLILDHNENIIISFFSILKSNNTYVPFSTKTNFSRIKESIDDLNINFLITDNHNFTTVQEEFKGKYIINIDDYLDISQMPSNYNKVIEDNETQDIVYIMHTSGSTGKPKGVKVTVNNLNYITENVQRITPCDEDSTLLFMTPYTFDVSITEICGWVYNGGAVVCRDLNSNTWFDDIREVLYKYNITHIAACPSVFSTMMNIYSNEINIFNDLKFVVLAGERFSLNIHKVWKESNWSFRLFNAYGPTEATVYCTLYELSKESSYDEIPIGTPLQGVEYIIDENTSELLISGQGITNGYLDYENTSKYFINVNDGLYYKTGDLVELNGGLLYFKGRNDNQIQLNGMRVELGEIENRIEEIEYVDQSKVIYKNNKIIAFIKTKYFDEEYFINYFSQNFEKHIIPNNFHLVSEFPLNQSKKVDKDRLIYNFLATEESDSKLNALELEIKELFENVLAIGKEKITKSSNFFNLGGDSLSSVLLLMELEERFNISITLSDIYNYPTIEQLSKYIDSLKKNKNIDDVLKKNDNIKIDIKSTTAELKNVADYIYRSGQIVSKYETLHLQRIYYYDNFESFIEFEYVFPKGEVFEVVVNLINDLIANVTMLRTGFIFEDDKLYFVEKTMENLDSIPIFDVSCQSIDYISNLKKNIKMLLMDSRKKGGLLNSLILLKNDKQYTLTGLMDHSIADASTPATILEIISNLKNEQKINFESTYYDYIKLIHKNNNMNEIMKSSFYQDLVKCGKDSEFDIKKMESSLNVYKVDLESNAKSLSTQQINLFLAYNIGQYLLKLFNQHSIVIKCLANGKDYLGAEYKYTLGDFHTSIYIVVYKDENYLDYKKRVEDSIKTNYVKKVFRPAYVYGSNYPIKNNDQKLLKNSLRHTTNTSIDFLGIIKECDLERYTKSVKQSLYQLTQIDDTLYVTVYLVNNQLVIYTNKDFLDFETFVKL